MPKYIPSMPFEDCFGSVGDLTFYHRNGQCYYRKRASPEFAGTMLQMEHQTVHLRALEAWRQLTPDLQKQWNYYSVGVQSHRPPFDGKSGITGHNLFVSACQAGPRAYSVTSALGGNPSVCRGGRGIGRG